MKRVKTQNRSVVSRTMLMAGLALVSAGVQASVTVSIGNIDAGSGSIYLVNPGIAQLPNPLIQVQQPIVYPAIPLNQGYASSSVSGSMYYSGSTGSGSFSENDASADGSEVTLELNRKGFGYRAGASAEAGYARASAASQIATGIYGNSSAGASSSWTDWFVITGGTGISTANFSSTLNGILTSGKNGSAGYSVSLGYSTDAYCYWWYNTCSEADQDQSLFSQTSSLTGKGNSTLTQAIDGEFTFAYDKPFKLTASLNVNVANGGSADFSLGSLGDSLELPEGALLSSASGLYAQAVPEADTWAMMFAGLGLVGWSAMRRRRMA